jgi:hypothetical protein
MNRREAIIAGVTGIAAAVAVAPVQDRWSDLRDGLVDDGRKREWEKGMGKSSRFPSISP